MKKKKQSGTAFLVVLLILLMGVLVWMMFSCEELPETSGTVDAPLTTAPAASAPQTTQTAPAETSTPAASTAEETAAPSQTSTVPAQTSQVPATSTAVPAVTDPKTLEASLGYDQALSARYAAYAASHPDLSPQDVVKEVNVGIDRPFYTDVIPVSDPDSLTVLVNKYHVLPEGYAPSDLVPLKYAYPGRAGSVKMRAEAAAAFDKMCEAAAQEGYTIQGYSGFRSYDYQKMIYNNYCKNDPQEVVDTYSARAGYSEHQTGLAIDVCTDQYAYNRFGRSEEYKWAKDNIHRFGFIIHYTEANRYLTGYKNEEWHFRYVGVELATFMYERGIVIDEYYALYGNNV